MAGANVSRAALTGVRMSLNQFKTEIADVPFSMQRNIDMLQSECENIIREVKFQIDRLEQEISGKNAEMRQLQGELSETRIRLRDTECAKQKTEQALAEIERETDSCERELLHLRATLSYGDENEQNQCQQAVYMAEKRLSELKDHGYQAAKEYRDLKNMICELQDDIGRIENAIGKTESEIQFLDAELSRKRSKWNRLDMAYSNLRSELDAFANSVRRFSEHALTQTQQDIAGVDQCIQYIDDYLATNL